MTARRQEKDEDPAAAAMDAEFVARCRESLDDPRPDIPAEEVFAELCALHEAQPSRDA
ncbi:MAG TPA: hypothetical protein VF574_15000 [Allosphingosinicella sp.]|jgi:hypothetical protein